MPNLNPACLWIGSAENLQNEALVFLKKLYCKSDSCNNCSICLKIDKKQHHNICWLEPEGQYTVSQIEIIFEKIVFKLDENERFFFIINRADLLNNACANSLLKSLEEPPAGYHFILLSPKKDGILPTVISRCVIQEFDNNFEDENILLKYFTTNFESYEFARELDRCKIAEHNMINFIDQIYFHWKKELEVGILNNNLKLMERAQKHLKILDVSRKYLPMPGSSKIFLKNLFLQFNII